MSWGGGVMVASYFYPGVGQVYMFYNVVTNFWSLVVEVTMDQATTLYYQGHVPNKDGTDGPAYQFDPKGGKLVGVLEPILESLKLYRSQLADRIRNPSTPPGERERLHEMTGKVYPLTVVGARSHTYNYFFPRLEEKMDDAGIREEERVAKLLSLHLPALYEEETDIDLRRAHVPPMLRAYFGRVLEDYRAGKNEFQIHRDLVANPVLRYRHYLTTGDRMAEHLQKTEGTLIVPALAHAFANALRGRLRGKDPVIKFDLEGWNATSAERILHGRSGSTFARHLPDGTSYEGTIPDAPSILDPYKGSTFEEKCASFFAHHDRILNELLANKKPKPVPDEERDNYKLGVHHSDLRNRAPEEGELRYSLLLSFFLKEIKVFWEKNLTYVDRSWLKKNELDKTMVQRKIAVMMANDFVSGLMRDIGEKQRRRDEQLLLPRLPHANALNRARAAALGEDPEDVAHAGAPRADWEPTPVDALRRASLWLLGLSSGDAHPFAGKEDEDGFFMADELAKVPAQYKIEIIPPKGPITEDSLGRFRCRIRATRHYKRPFRCEWSIQGADAAGPPGGVADTNMRVTALKLGEELKEKKVTVTVHVTDSSDPPQPLGSKTATVTLKGKPKGKPTVTVHVQYRREWDRVVVSVDVERMSVLGLTPEMYAGLPKGDEGRTVFYWLMRFDYDGMTTYSLEELNPSTLRRDSNRFSARLPVRRIGPIPVDVTIYTGRKTMPVLKQSFRLEIPEPAPLKKHSAETLENRRQHILRMVQLEKEKAPIWARSIRERSDYSDWNSWVTSYVERVSAYMYTDGPLFTVKLHARLLRKIDDRLARVGTTYWHTVRGEKKMRRTFVSRAFSMKHKILMTVGMYDELNAHLLALERALKPPALPESSFFYGHRAYYIGDDEYKKLIDAYLDERLDAKTALELVGRYNRVWSASTATSRKMKLDRRDQARVKRARVARAFFPREAFR